MNALSRFDTNALNHLNRALIGFDRLLPHLVERTTSSPTYPPYNVIKKDEDHYEIEFAVAGFTLSEIEVEVDKNQLIVKGRKEVEEYEDGDAREYLHRGLAYRNFDKYFTLGEYMQVGEAVIKDGILRITIKVVVPEELKPRKIQVLGYIK